jgi:hypothetical protein
MERLRGQVDGARLSKALVMLQAERFQLYAQADGAALVGVVKSQSNPTLSRRTRLVATSVPVPPRRPSRARSAAE